MKEISHTQREREWSTHNPDVGPRLEFSVDEEATTLVVDLQAGRRRQLGARV